MKLLGNESAFEDVVVTDLRWCPVAPLFWVAGKDSSRGRGVQIWIFPRSLVCFPLENKLVDTYVRIFTSVLRAKLDLRCQIEASQLLLIIDNFVSGNCLLKVEKVCASSVSSQLLANYVKADLCP